jgi:hypothetical protein
MPKTGGTNELSGFNNAASALAAYASRFGCPYTRKARFRVRGLAFPDRIRFPSTCKATFGKFPSRCYVISTSPFPRLSLARRLFVTIIQMKLGAIESRKSMCPQGKV